MSVTPFRTFACLCAVLVVTDSTRAQTELDKQKAATEAVLKKVKVSNVAATETDGVRVFAQGSTDNARAIADSLQKVYQTSRNSLNLAANDALWPGKLTVIVLSDPVQYAAYIQQTQGRQPRPGETTAMNLQGDAPYLVIGPATGTSAATFDPAKAAARLMATAVLNQQAGMTGNNTLPDWLASGFTEGMLARADGSAEVMSTYRNSLRTAVLGDPVRAPQMAVLADSFGGRRADANPAQSAAFVEYLMARNDSARFNRFLNAFNNADADVPGSGMRAAFRTLPLSRISMETDFKVWAAQQR